MYIHRYTDMFILILTMPSGSQPTSEEIAARDALIWEILFADVADSECELLRRLFSP